MGNQGCCQQQMNQATSFKADQTVELRPSVLNHSQKIQDFFQRCPTIKRMYDENKKQCQSDINLQDNYSRVFLHKAHEYSLDEGVFIGNLSGINKTRNGFGLMLYYNNSYYEGEWDENMKSGRGTFVSEQGEYYHGQWKNNLAHGQGLFKSLIPSVSYQGEWNAGAKHGRGKQSYQDGSTYTGWFSINQKQGEGTILYRDGTSYKGQFHNNQIQGEGVFTGKNHRYEGSWRYGRMHGAGKSEWFDQRGKILARYMGEYRDGIKQGFGEYIDNEGVAYKANWIDGKIDQRGPITIDNNQ